MWTADPIAVPLTTPVSPVAAPDVNDSPSLNVGVSLSVPEFLYFTNKVSGSVPSVKTNPTTWATTPDVAPVKLLPLKFANVPVKEVNFTALYWKSTLVHQE